MNESAQAASLPRRQPLSPDATRELDPEEVMQLAERNKIEAIKLVRERTGMGLKEAKDYVDRMR